MKDRSISLTGDGSHSVYSEKFQALYHSKHGAIQESQHVFIESGFEHIKRQYKNLSILEMGMGTGLNILLTYIQSEINPELNISYDSIEAYPINETEASKLNYLKLLKRNDLSPFFTDLHSSEWNTFHNSSFNFTYRKIKGKVEDLAFDKQYDLVFYDAFAPLIQEELWTPQIFQQIAKSLNDNAVLVSFCCKGSFKRAIISAGFNIEKIPGPPGKREMIRATFYK